MAGPLLGRLGELDAAVLVARPRLADLHALASWLEGRSLDGEVGLVLVGDGPYPDAEITQALGLEVLARVPWDSEAAEALTSVPTCVRQLRLAPLVRAARTLADRLAREPGENVPVAATGLSGRAVAMRSRVLRAWRAGAEPSSNGNVPREASR